VQAIYIILRHTINKEGMEMETEIENLALKIANEIISMRDFYPQLCDYNKIRRLLNLADLLINAMEGVI
jgi:hypothetical protein